MRRDSDIHDTDFERFLRGQSPAGDGVDSGVSGFFEQLDRAVPVGSTGHLEAVHVAAMMAAREAGAADTVAMPPIAARSARSRSLLPRWGKVAAMSLVAALALGTTAYAGLLPAAVQDAVSAAVRPLGIEIPSSIRTEDLPVEVEPMTQGAEKADSAPRLGPVGGEGAVQRRAATPAPEELKEQTKKKASQKRKAEKGAKKAKPGTPAEEAERGDAGRGEGAKGRQGREDDAAADKQDTSNGTRKQGRESARP